jgi:hypothetical protein
MIGVCELVVLLTSLKTRFHNPLRLVESQCNCVLRFQGPGRKSIGLSLRLRLDAGPTTRVESDVAGSLFGKSAKGLEAPKVNLQTEAGLGALPRTGLARPFTVWRGRFWLGVPTFGLACSSLTSSAAFVGLVRCSIKSGLPPLYYVYAFSFFHTPNIA